MTTVTLGTLMRAFFVDYLSGQKGLRPTSIRSYRDGVRLFLCFVATDAKQPIGALQIADLTFERALSFLQHLEAHRHNHVATRNQRLAALRTLFEYMGRRVPEMLHVCERVSAIPTKRTPLPDTRFLDQHEVAAFFARLPRMGRLARRDHALMLMLYNTGARVQEMADLRIEHLSLTSPPHVRLHGKGDKWRTCPLWKETAHVLRLWLDERRGVDPQAPVFTSATGRALTRFGIFKRVRHHAAALESGPAPPRARRITPHVFRHTTAVHLLEAGVEVNVIRGWLGHVSLDTTNRYAEITVRMKEAAMRLCAPPVAASDTLRKPDWRKEATLLDWLSSL